MAGEQENDVELPQIEKTSMDDLTEKETFPDVKENAIAAVQAKNEAGKEAEETISQETSVKYKKDGTIAKKRGRKSKSETFNNPREKTEIKTDPKANIEVSSKHAAQVTSGLIEQMTVKLISKDWLLNDMERNSNVDAWEQTYDYYGGVNLSPPMNLALNQMGIILTRFASSTETKTKFQLIKAWAKNKVVKFKNRKKENALSDTGENTKRENNMGKKESSQPPKTSE